MQAKLTVEKSEAVDLLERYQAALLLWLRWHDAQQRITRSMFDARHDQVRLTQLMDQLDALRQEAVRVSNELIELTDGQQPS